MAIQPPKGTDATPRSLLQGNEAGAVLLVVVAGDKGLCGAFNSHILKQGEARYRELAAAGREVVLVTVGTKAGRYFSKRGLEPVQAYNGMIGRLQFADAARLGTDLQQRFLAGALHSVEFAASEFVSASKQEFRLRRLFPVEVAAPERPDIEAGSEAEGYIFEPGADAIFQALLPRFVTAAVYQVLLQSVAAEQVARMVAMDLATRNASDMIRELTLLMNKMRQAAITKELLEIITATEALNK
jgi:F-type H+-transporting ATPase subunit gamma